jgi:L-rhamnose mutarotase
MAYEFKIKPDFDVLTKYQYKIPPECTTIGQEIGIAIQPIYYQLKGISKEFNQEKLLEMLEVCKPDSLKSTQWETLKFVLLVEAAIYIENRLISYDHLTLEDGYKELGSLLNYLTNQRSKAVSINLVGNNAAENLIKLNNPVFFDMLKIFLEHGISNYNMPLSGEPTTVQIIENKNWEKLANLNCHKSEEQIVQNKTIFIIKIKDFLQTEKIITCRKGSIIGKEQAYFIYQVGLNFNIFEECRDGYGMILSLLKYNNKLAKDYKTLVKREI